MTGSQEITDPSLYSHPDTVPTSPDHVVLRVAMSAYLGRHRGDSRMHTEPDLVAPRRTPLPTLHRFPPLSVVVGFYRVCVIDAILPYSPADYVRRPVVPPESRTLGLSHLQFEILITIARRSENPSDYALIAMLGLLGLRIFEACSADIGLK